MHAVVLSNARKVCTWSPIHTWWNLNNSWTDTLRKRTRCAFDGWNLKKSWTDTLVRPATRTFGVCSYNARSAVRCRSVHRQHQHHARWGWKRERVATRTHGEMDPSRAPTNCLYRWSTRIKTTQLTSSSCVTRHWPYYSWITIGRFCRSNKVKKIKWIAYHLLIPLTPCLL